MMNNLMVEMLAVVQRKRTQLVGLLQQTVTSSDSEWSSEDERVACVVALEMVRREMSAGISSDYIERVIDAVDLATELTRMRTKSQPTKDARLTQAFFHEAKQERPATQPPPRMDEAKQDNLLQLEGVDLLKSKNPALYQELMNVAERVQSFQQGVVRMTKGK